MKICNNCGNKLSNSMKFCNKCGCELVPFNKEENKEEENLDKDKNLLGTKKDVLPKNSISNNPIIDTSFNNFKKEKVKNLNKEPSSFEEYEKPRNKGVIKRIIKIFFLFIILLLLVSSIYFLKNPVLYKYYYNSALKSSSVIEKLENYNKALSYSKNEDLLNSIYETLKADTDFVDNAKILSNLKAPEKNKLMAKIYVNKASLDFENKDYKSCDSNLNLAVKYGYTKKDFLQYDALEKKLKEEKNISSNKKNNSSNIFIYKNESPSEFSGNIYDYPYDFIMPDSDSAYLAKYNICSYNNTTLDLIKNEIYARHGYVFKEPKFKKYFESKSWYKPDPYFTGNDSELNNYEVENVKLINEIEASR